LLGFLTLLYPYKVYVLRQGQARYASGTTQTDKTYTGQRSFMGDGSVGSGQALG